MLSEIHFRLNHLYQEKTQLTARLRSFFGKSRLNLYFEKQTLISPCRSE